MIRPAAIITFFASFFLLTGWICSGEQQSAILENPAVSDGQIQNPSDVSPVQIHARGVHGLSVRTKNRSVPRHAVVIEEEIIENGIHESAGAETTEILCEQPLYLPPVQCYGRGIPCMQERAPGFIPSPQCPHLLQEQECPFQRQGRICPLRNRELTPLSPPLPLPIKEHPLPSPQPRQGLFGGLATPRQYPQRAPMPYPAENPAAYSNGAYPGAYSFDPNGAAYPVLANQGQVPYYGQPSGQSQTPYREERIVYVPYASPPPIYVERLGKALPRPPILRQILGDANMYEYPEMPMQFYTTRGPRDFLATNPPSIGE